MTWFFVILLTKYVDSQWIENFYMFKETFFDRTKKMKPFISKIDTRYCLENWYVLPYVKGAIGGTHISILKPNIPFVKRLLLLQNMRVFYCLPSNNQSKKMFIDIFVSLPNNVNDSRVLHKPSLYQ